MRIPISENANSSLRLRETLLENITLTQTEKKRKEKENLVRIPFNTNYPNRMIIEKLLVLLLSLLLLMLLLLLLLL